MKVGGHLIIPYGISDSAVGFAVAEVDLIEPTNARKTPNVFSHVPFSGLDRRTGASSPDGR